MEMLNYTTMHGKRYKLPEGYHAVETRYSVDQIYNSRGENVSHLIMGHGTKRNIMIIQTENGIHELEPID